ncbi:MAG: ATP-dependent zinc protease [Porticoccaceae bacterium]
MIATISPRFICVFLLSMLTPLASAAEREPKVFGWVEKAIVMPVGATVKAKLDSGARTSSMDAKNIQMFKRDGEDWVSFRLHLEDNESGDEVYRDLEMPIKRIVRLRGAGGEDRRPTVELSVCIGDQVYREEFTLRDRDNMFYPMLLGRRTIEHLGLLDVTTTFTVPPTCTVSQNLDEVIEVDRE